MSTSRRSPSPRRLKTSQGAGPVPRKSTAKAPAKAPSKALAKT